MTRAYFTTLSSTTPLDRCPFCKPPNCDEKKTPRGSTIEMRTKFLSTMHEGARLEPRLKSRVPEEPANAEGDGHCLATSSKCMKTWNGAKRTSQIRKKGSLREIPTLSIRNQDAF